MADPSCGKLIVCRRWYDFFPINHLWMFENLEMSWNFILWCVWLECVALFIANPCFPFVDSYGSIFMLSKVRIFCLRHDNCILLHVLFFFSFWQCIKGRVLWMELVVESDYIFWEIFSLSRIDSNFFNNFILCVRFFLRFRLSEVSYL